MNINNSTNINYNNYYYNNNKTENVTSASPAFCGIVEKFGKEIRGQKDCWKLYEDEVMDSFIKSDKDLEDALGEVLPLLRGYGVKIGIQALEKMKNFFDISKFYEVTKSKYDIDLTIPPRVYRYVGKSEADALQRGEIIHPQRYPDRFDVTINPEMDWNKYKITFKPLPKFSAIDPKGSMKKNNGTSHEYYYHYTQPSYTMEDVEKIECKLND